MFFVLLSEFEAVECSNLEQCQKIYSITGVDRGIRENVPDSCAKILYKDWIAAH